MKRTVKTLAAAALILIWAAQFVNAQSTSLSGYLEPYNSDEMGNPISVSLVVFSEAVSDDEEAPEPSYYIIEEKGKGLELLKHVGSRTKIKGIVTKKSGVNTLKVISYEIEKVEEETEPIDEEDFSDG